MNDERRQSLRALESFLGYGFADLTLLDNALTHRSFVNENNGISLKDNERLEFLGDAVLELTVSDMLMKTFPEAAEGELSKWRASVVNEQPLAELARRFRIGEFLLLGRGEEASHGRMKPSLLANAFESIVAAMYLDAGFERTSLFVRQLFTPLIEEGAKSALYRDYKTAVQELCQVRFHEVPRYAVLAETGPDHDKRFATGLVVGEQVIATGEGRNKKEAEQKAAKAALEKLQEESAPSPPPEGPEKTAQPREEPPRLENAATPDPKTAGGEAP